MMVDDLEEIITECFLKSFKFGRSHIRAFKFTVFSMCLGNRVSVTYKGGVN